MLSERDQLGIVRGDNLSQLPVGANRLMQRDKLLGRDVSAGGSDDNPSAAGFKFNVLIEQVDWHSAPLPFGRGRLASGFFADKISNGLISTPGAA